MPRTGYAVFVQTAPRYARYVRERALAAVARRALSLERAPLGSLVSVVLTDDAAIRDLNRRFLGVDEETDVLSFALASDEEFVSPGVDRELGEIVISYSTAARQARAGRRAVEDELKHLLVHGVLHLLGYDHEKQTDERRMRAREDFILGRQAH